MIRESYRGFRCLMLIRVRHIEQRFSPIVIQVLNHYVIPEIFYRESNDRSSIQAFEDDDWGI